MYTTPSIDFRVSDGGDFFDVSYLTFASTNDNHLNKF